MIEEVRYEPSQIRRGKKGAGRVWINKQQYFEGISEAVWRFVIGGYFPAERWLKDRKDRALSFETRKSIRALSARLRKRAY